MEQWLADLPEHLRAVEPYVRDLSPYGRYFLEPLVRRLFRRYEDDTEKTRTDALENTKDASRRFATEVKRLVDSGRLTPEEAADRFEDPGFVKSLQDLLIASGEVSSSDLHEALATVLAERLTAKTLSRKSILLRRSAESIHEVTPRQLLILGFVYTLNHLVLSDAPIEDAGQLSEYLEKSVAPVIAVFDTIEPDALDWDYFAELQLVRLLRGNLITGAGVNVDPPRGRLLRPVQEFAQQFGQDVSGNPTYLRLLRLMNGSEEERGYNDVVLTPTGLILGKCVSDIERGKPFSLDDSDWNEPN